MKSIRLPAALWPAGSATGAGPLEDRLRREGDTRTPVQVREHYRIERQLSDRLRHAGPAARRALYRAVYDELFRCLPHHPQLQPVDPLERLAGLERLDRLVRRFLPPGGAVLEIGAGDCALSERLCAAARRVIALDVSEEILGTERRRPDNLSVVLSDGCSIPLPAGSVDLAISNQVMEHLHPDDAREQLANIHHALAPGGRYLCITPHRLYGPHDISAYFDDEATGFHLHEYSAGELRRELLAAGFARVRFHACLRGRVIPMPWGLIAALEGLLGALPAGVRRRAAGTAPMRALLGIVATAEKSRPS